jgi:two-component system, sensor histidine kinase and response regulator
VSDSGSAEWRVSLSTLPAGTQERWRALGVVLVSLLVFALAAPFAKTRLPPVMAFVPSYESALAINDLVTAILLFGQFSILRWRAILLLASGYLFTALMAVPHALSFPGLFSETGLLGGSQTTAWLYMLWHGGFPLAVIGYALLKERDRERPAPTASARGPILASVIGVAVLVGLLALAASNAVLPPLMAGSGFTPMQVAIIATVWALSLVALVVLALQRPHSILDVWLMVVMCAWLFDVALSGVLNASRFDLGFYAGRIYGLMAATFVLLVLLLETGALYSRLARSLEAEAREREERLKQVQSELIHVSRVNEMGLMVWTLSHELNQPLSAINNYLRAGQMLAERSEMAKLRATLQRAGEESGRASQIIQRLRNFVKKGETERRVEDIRATLEEARTLAVADAGERGSIEISAEPGLPSALIDKVQIQQVLLNLIRNALEAMAESPRREIVVSAFPADGDMIEVRVADTGPGLAPEVRERLFRPFTTTKAHGMGVGLSICRSIVEAHGGRLWATDNPGGGTLFRFTVPGARVDRLEDWRQWRHSVSTPA